MRQQEEEAGPVEDVSVVTKMILTELGRTGFRMNRGKVDAEPPLFPRSLKSVPDEDVADLLNQALSAYQVLSSELVSANSYKIGCKIDLDKAKRDASRRANADDRLKNAEARKAAVEEDELVETLTAAHEILRGVVSGHERRLRTASKIIERCENELTTRSVRAARRAKKDKDASEREAMQEKLDRIRTSARHAGSADDRPEQGQGSEEGQDRAPRKPVARRRRFRR